MDLKDTLKKLRNVRRDPWAFVDAALTQSQKNLVDAAFVRRTGFKADDRGKIISGCGQCSRRYIEPGMVPVTRCRKVIERDGQHMLIADPFNIPAVCPIRIRECKTP
jgi:hypothetical protein